MHAISSYRGNRPTHTPTNKQDRLQYTAPLASAQCIEEYFCMCVCVHVYVCVQQVCVEEGELIPADSLEIFRPLTVCDGLPLEGCVLSIRYILWQLVRCNC